MSAQKIIPHGIQRSPPEAVRSKLILEISLFLLLAIVTSFLSFFYFSIKDRAKTQSQISSAVLPNRKPDLTLTPTLTLTQKCSSVTPIPESGGGSTLEKTPKIGIINLEMVGEKDIFSPAQFTVHKNQIISLHITAKDKIYDFSLPEYGLAATIPKGENKSIQFQATNTGQFVFSCQENCRNPKMSCGFLTVQP